MLMVNVHIFGSIFADQSMIVSAEKAWEGGSSVLTTVDKSLEILSGVLKVLLELLLYALQKCHGVQLSRRNCDDCNEQE